MTERHQDFEARLDGLEERLDDAARMTAAFDAELARTSRTMALTGREVQTLSQAIGGTLRRAFDCLVFDGHRLGDALRGVAAGLSGAVYGVAMQPVQSALGGAMAQGINAVMSAFQPFAAGAGFAQGRVVPFAQGGVVTAPTAFSMRGGQTGLMGEAGPEAILPLARGPDGRLGVQAQPSAGSRAGRLPAQVTINIATPDVEGFRRSQTQIAAQMARLLSRGDRVL